ncbi:uncharacterized protein LOC106881515 [Octopus bimaculoides]|uniref:uncharacterized protein LOC106881515 n=1 Tax=Octopus bimaculoides TaxID=37653 RepID=UPI00071DE1D6|nr:uncharacterized protein LOC106881515 [Octopus bimaculoides]|eukprot:XP_014787417.1 PREDICTED: uncharacterized protein LOC106881515 [Octopus bimaculoides]
MTARISIRVLFVFVIALTENGVKGVSKTDEEVVNEVLHLPTPNEIIEEIENDPTFWDERNVRFQLAATFGKLQFESLKMIDENLKVTSIFLKVDIAFQRSGKVSKYAGNVAGTKNQQILKRIRQNLHVIDPANVLQKSGETREINPRFEIAATFGNLTFESLKLMDKYLQMMVSGVMKAIKDMKVSSWEELLDYFDEVPYLKMFNSTRDGFHEGMIKFERDDVAKLFKDIDYTMVNNIESWFYRFIQDSTILRETKIDIREIALVAATQAFKYDIEHLILERDTQTAVVMDMAILRFPDAYRPYFQVFVIKVLVRRTYVRLLWKRTGTSIVMGKFNAIKYHPNKRYIEHLKKKTQDALMADIEDLFS